MLVVRKYYTVVRPMANRRTQDIFESHASPYSARLEGEHHRRYVEESSFHCIVAPAFTISLQIIAVVAMILCTPFHEFVGREGKAIDQILRLLSRFFGGRLPLLGWCLSDVVCGETELARGRGVGHEFAVKIAKG